MRKAGRCAIRVIALCLVLAAAVSADTLRMKDGRVLQGRYLGGTQVSVRFEMNGEVKTFAVADVASVTFTRGTQNSAAPDSNQGSAPNPNPPDMASPDPANPSVGQPPDASTNNAELPVVSQDRIPEGSNPPTDAAAVPPTAANPPSAAPLQEAPVPRPGSSSGPPAQPAPAPGASAQITLPVGQELLVRMIDGVDSSKNQVGDPFRASLETDLYVGGIFIARKGTEVYGTLSEAKDSGKFSGRPELQLLLTKMVIDGRDYPLVSSDYTVKGQSRNSDTAKKVGGGAIIGAIIGGIVGGGKGAAIGAGAGAGTGAVAEVLTKGEKVRVPSETLLEFRLEQPAVVVPTQR